MGEFKLFNPIRVIGVGGGGANAVDRMIQVGVAGVDFIAANTDLQALKRSESPNQIHLGPRAARGLGAGANPEVGARAALESQAAIAEVCEGAELIFVASGMGGGTGSGAAPAVARVARSTNAVVVGVVTMPFTFEGTRRRKNAEKALDELREEVDTVVVVYNDRLLKILDPQHARVDIAFRVADECLRQAVEGISGLIHNPGLINLDFADVKAVLRNGGDGHFSIGYGQGDKGAQQALRRALTSPLLGQDGIEGAGSVIVNFRGCEEMGFHDMAEAMNMVEKLVAKDASIFFGTSVDPSLGDRIEVTLMAVGLDTPAVTEAQPLQATKKASQGVPLSLLGSQGARKSPSTPVRARRERREEGYALSRSQTERKQQNRRPARPWKKVAPDVIENREDPYPMDDLSIPAFIRRRRKVSA